MQDRQPPPTLPPLRPRLQSWEETRSLIPEKGPPEEDPDIVVKGGDDLMHSGSPNPSPREDTVFSCSPPFPPSPGPRLAVP